MPKRILCCVLCLLLYVVPAFAQDNDEAYQEALRRIEEARVNGATELDLGLRRLTTLPPEIGQLSQLERLSLDSTKMTSLPPEIGQLTNLQFLDLKGSPLTSLPPEIGQLSQLQYLDLNDSDITYLPPEIGQLSQLVYLDLGHTKVKSLPAEIGNLSQLKNLDLQSPITALPLELGQLTQLETIVRGNRIKFPPPEIVSQGTPAILAYLRDYQAMLMRQTAAAVAAGIGGIAVVMLAFRWRQRRGLHKKNKR